MDVLSMLAFIAAMCQLPLVKSALAPLSDPVRIGYHSLMEDLLKHPAVQFKIPPSPAVTTSFNSSYHKNKTIVEIQLYPTNFLELNGNQEVMVMTAYLQLTWNHPDLIWNSSEYEGVALVELQASQIWTPSLTVMSEVEEKNIALDESISLTINYTGGITVELDKHFKTYCKMDFTYFPFDEQNCSITFLSASLTPITLMYTNDITGSFMRENSQGGEWNITDMYWTKISSSSSYQRSVLKAVFVLRRWTYFYSITLIGPMCVSALMNCLVFTIPLEAGEKVSFLISIFLSNTVFSGYLSDIMPHSFQTKFPMLMILLIGLWLWSVLTFLATTFVLYRYHQEQKQVIGDNVECQQINLEKKIPAITFLSNIFNKRNKVMNLIQPNLFKKSSHSEIIANTQNNSRIVLNDSTNNDSETHNDKKFLKPKDDNGTLVTSNHEKPDDPKLYTTLSIKRQNFNKLKAKTLDQIFLCLSVTTLILIITIFFLNIIGKHSFF